MKDRIEYFDFLRGIAIIGVIIIHVTSVGLVGSDDSIGYYITMVMRQIVNFSVPLFLSISGYFLFLIFENYYSLFSILYLIPKYLGGAYFKK